MGESQLLRPGPDPGAQREQVRRLAALPEGCAVTMMSDLSTVHPRILGTRQLRWPDEDACAAQARALAARPALREAFVTLHGGLGAGKTTFVRHLLRGLGVAGRIKSPTYAVVEPHRAGSLEISHFDFYRLDDPREWEDAGFREVFARPGLKLAEWPEKAAGFLPVADLEVWISVDADEGRTVRLDALTPRGLELLP